MQRFNITRVKKYCDSKTGEEKKTYKQVGSMTMFPDRGDGKGAGYKIELNMFDGDFAVFPADDTQGQTKGNYGNSRPAQKTSEYEDAREALMEEEVDLSEIPF